MSVFFIDSNDERFALKFRMEGVSQSGGWLRFWTGNEQLSGQSELISQSEGRRRKEGGGRKLVHESVVARDRVAVVHERAIHETIMIGRLVRAYLAVSLSAIKSVI